jgi:uncharacterized protein (TIGR02646 family)
MIKVERTEKPKSLQKHEAKWLKKIQEALDLAAKAITDEEKEKAKKTLENALGKYSQKDVKDTLVEKMFHSKCAYCEAKITHIDYGDIEHFRPKDTFPLLAVAWENLLLACRVCNGAEFKGIKFPLDSSGNPLLINPCIDNLNNHLEFEFDETTKFAIIVSKDEKGLTSIDTYGLNRNRHSDDLIRHRSKFINNLVTLANYYHTDKKAKEILDKACENLGEYAAFARMVKDKYTKVVI